MDSPPRIEVHQSELKLFEMCGMAYQLQYLDGHKAYPGTAALRGSAVHGAAEENYKQKVTTAKDLTKPQLVDAAVASFEERKEKEGFRLTPEEQSAGAKPALARALNTATILTGVFADKLAPLMQPKYVELKIRAEIPGTNVDLVGTVDVATHEHEIEDLKTSTRSKSQSEADTTPQFGQYGILYHAHSGVWPKKFYLDTLVDKKVPDHQRLTTIRTAKDYEVYVNRLNTLLRARATGVFHPAPAGHWFCSAKWCDHFMYCPMVNSERLAASAKLED